MPGGGADRPWGVPRSTSAVRLRQRPTPAAAALRHDGGVYYQIEAVRWNEAGHISHVRWHSVRFDGEQIRRGESTVAAVIDAAEQCNSHEVRVYVDGDTGHFFKMKACDEGIDAEVDEAGTPLRERMAHLPTF
jgi:hypothetical protein